MLWGWTDKCLILGLIEVFVNGKRAAISHVTTGKQAGLII